MANDERKAPAVRGPALQDLVRQGRLAWRLLTDKRVPILVKSIPALAVVYLVSPLDFVPDVFPVLGQLDDLAVMLLALRLFIEMAPPEIVSELKGTAPDTVTTTYRVQDEP
jgi:uncharacterized membrane protein YkvA (DUF1232 family)